MTKNSHFFKNNQKGPLYFKNEYLKNIFYFITFSKLNNISIYII